MDSTIASYIANRRWAMGTDYPFLVKEVSEVPNENPSVHDPDLTCFRFHDVRRLGLGIRLEAYEGVPRLTPVKGPEDAGLGRLRGADHE